MRGQSLSGVSYLPGQLELAGTEPSTRKMLERRASKPMRPNKPQRACDHGLFSDDADQLDLNGRDRKGLAETDHDAPSVRQYSAFRNA